MTPPADALLRAASEGRFADACSRTAEYVASVEEGVRTLAPGSAEAAEMIASALTTLEETRRLVLCQRATLAVRLEEVRNARRYSSPATPASTVSVSG